jgi:hypothetical protein
MRFIVAKEGGRPPKRPFHCRASFLRARVDIKERFLKNGSGLCVTGHGDLIEPSVQAGGHGLA